MVSAVVPNWKPLTDAPKDGTPLLVVTGEEVNFFQWMYNPWIGYDCFTSMDEERKRSVPSDLIANSVYIELAPPYYQKKEL